MSALLAAAALLLLVLAAWRDVATRTIPNTISILLFIIGGFARALQGPTYLALSISSALLLFVILMIAYSRAFIGGGDVKIMSTFALGLSPYDGYRFVIGTALAGGVLGVAYFLVLRNTRCVFYPPPASPWGRIVSVELWRIHRRGPLPYGVAIAAGGGFALIGSGSF